MHKPHRKLDVWGKSVELATEIYSITSTFPAHERYGLMSQMRRASVSVASNLAEGAARSTAEFRQFLRIALGSTSELDTQLEICHRLGYLKTSTYQKIDQKLTEVDRMLLALRKSLVVRRERERKGAVNGE